MYEYDTFDKILNANVPPCVIKDLMEQIDGKDSQPLLSFFDASSGGFEENKEETSFSTNSFGLDTIKQGPIPSVQGVLAIHEQLISDSGHKEDINLNSVNNTILASWDEENPDSQEDRKVTNLEDTSNSAPESPTQLQYVGGPVGSKRKRINVNLKARKIRSMDRYEK